jgi:hypothetical protein
MAQQCGLTTPLVIKDLQSGYVGQTGTVWTIEPDCSYSVARQIGLKIGEPHKRGRLSAEQAQRLTALIDRADLGRLPNQLGSAPQPNARQITIAYGRNQSALTLPPGSEAAAVFRAVGSDPRATHVLELMHALNDMVGG